MYRRYDFKKIFEAEQLGEPLNPTDMGLQQNPETKLINSHEGYELEITLNNSEIDDLLKNGFIETTDSHWKKLDNSTVSDRVQSLTIEIADYEELSEDGDIKANLKLTRQTLDRVIGMIIGGSSAKHAVNQTPISFIKDIETKISTTADLQKTAEITDSILPNESTKTIIGFDDFLNEKKRDIVADAFDEILRIIPKKKKIINKSKKKKIDDYEI